MQKEIKIRKYIFIRISYIIKFEIYDNFVLELVGVYIVGYSIVLTHMIIIMKCEASDIVLPNVLVIVGETVGEEEEAG